MEKINRRIIFLDVDGVLNSQIIADEWFHKTMKGGYGGFFEEDTVVSEEDIKWGHLNFSNLWEIHRQTKAEIIISSDWRKHFSLDKFGEIFAVYGWKDAPIIGKTEVLGNRGMEINEWLNRNEDVESYVILDDNDWFLPEQKVNFVHTNPETGLLWKDVQKAIEILTYKTKNHEKRPKTPYFGR